MRFRPLFSKLFLLWKSAILRFCFHQLKFDHSVQPVVGGFLQRITYLFSSFSIMDVSQLSKHASKMSPKSSVVPTKEKAAKGLSCESNCFEEARRPELSTLEEAFRKFAIHGDTRATGKEMHEKNWSKLCKDCHVIDNKNVTLIDVDIIFSKIKGKSRTITFGQFKEALQELSKKRFKDKNNEEAVQEMHKLIEGKVPVISGVTKTVSSPTVSRLTDTARFTGSHKERFDPTGQGKGKAGREDLLDMSGYVSGYKHAGTYDQKIQGSK